MRYLHSDPSSCAGPLIPKRRAPKCANCGRVLWTPIWKDDRYPQRNAKGERLGYVPCCREKWAPGREGYPRPTGKVRCWNSKACVKRREASDE